MHSCERTGHEVCKLAGMLASSVECGEPAWEQGPRCPVTVVQQSSFRASATDNSWAIHKQRRDYYLKRDQIASDRQCGRGCQNDGRPTGAVILDPRGAFRAPG